MPRRVGMRAVSPPSPQHDRRREADVVPELQLPELPRSYPGYPLPHLSRTLVLVQLIVSSCFLIPFIFIRISGPDHQFVHFEMDFDLGCCPNFKFECFCFV
eukprot:TRINITY_DN11614_c0_g1_i1.p2 TRINITY_DN11614_c0_g1~~TRINITY_DN11614_c0_g1_i1.p2  ORF type:complete len:101 (-),score=7.62 TRINITY_DN11614_c0_g1_i1:1231-1533(-)